MDPELIIAAREGDVEFLKDEVDKHRPYDYFLAQYYSINIFQIAILNDGVDFLKAAMNVLPKDLQKQLLLQPGYMSTVLHTAASKNNILVIKCIIEMYQSLSWDDDDDDDGEDHFKKPLLALNPDNETPLHVALMKTRVDEKCVMELMLLDPEHRCWTIADNNGNTPLYYALKKRCNLVVENVLKFLKEANPVQPSDYFFAESTRENVFHVAADQGNVEFLKKAMSILPIAILKQPLLQTTDGDMYTVLHRAALNKDVTLVKYITEMYASLSWVVEDQVKPWLALTRDNKTPLHLALRLDEPDEKCVMEILLMDAQLTSCTIADEDGNKPLYYAVKNGLNLVVENISMSPHPATSIN